MHAVILAAGAGERLGDAAGDKPKCLLEFAGRSLLARHLAVLDYYHIVRLTVVVGYQAEMIESELARAAGGMQISTRHNPDYRDGSVVSLACAQDALCTGEPVLLMDADVLYDHRLLGRLLTTRHRNCFLLDRDLEPGDEPVKLCVRNGRLIDFRKRIDKNLVFDFQGESVGFFRFEPRTACALATTTHDYVIGGRRNEPYEEAIRDHLLAAPDAFAYEDITGLAWIEIDYPDDVQRARQVIAPQLAPLSPE